MPVSIKRSPFNGKPAKTAAPKADATSTPAAQTAKPDVPARLALRTPQARVLAALMPSRPGCPAVDRPTFNRALLGVRAGYTAISGTITRVLNGIRAGSSSGDAHPGLLERGMIEELSFDIEGVKEVNYRITALGIEAFQAHIAAYGELPPQRDKAVCVNDRYKKPTQTGDAS